MQKFVLNTGSLDHQHWLVKFVDVYQSLTIKNLELLSDVYHPNVTFIDPMHQVEGIDALHQYFKNLYQNLSTCDFVIENVIASKEQAAIYWKMTYQHSKLNKGQLVTVYGNSLIKGDGHKVIYHRDYLDLGAMLYEQIPVFGQLTKWIKMKAAR